MAQSPVCFVVMPFGTKSDAMGGTIDFDLIYRALIAPAVAAAGFSPLRADEDSSSGLLMQASLARVIGAPLVVFDVSTANANVLYELGIRHGLRAQTTMIICSQTTRLPWDLSNLRVLMYQLNSTGRPENPEAFQRNFTEHVRKRQQYEQADSPVYALFPELQPPALGKLAQETRPDALAQTEEIRQRIAAARRLGIDELRDVDKTLGDLSGIPSDITLTLFDAYRSKGAWSDLIELARRAPPAIASSTRVREQLALALNRTGRGDEAERMLQEILSSSGDSSETWGLLGRIYKDRWNSAADREGSRRLLDQAIHAYVRGFETDWRDPYPGVNAVTLMTLREPPDPRLEELLPVVLYAVKRRLATSSSDYWDAATLLELYVLSQNKDEARKILPRVLAEAREAWQSQSTARNLQLIATAFERRKLDVGWVTEICQQLDKQ